MMGADIFDGDECLMDRSITPKQGEVAVSVSVSFRRPIQGLAKNEPVPFTIGQGGRSLFMVLGRDSASAVK